MEEKLILGDYYENIKCESFVDPETRRIRIRPLEGQGLSTKLVISCYMKLRKAYPIGTKFKTDNVLVCKQSDGRIYLYAKDKMIYKI